jgi:ABC-2 type transport system permease protein
MSISKPNGEPPPQGPDPQPQSAIGDQESAIAPPQPTIGNRQSEIASPRLPLGRRQSSLLPPQPSLTTILTPKWRSALNRLRQERSGGNGKFFLLALVALGFWAGVFGLSYRILRYIQSSGEVGAPLAAKFLGIVLLAFASLLLLSNLITALSSFFLAKDLDLLVSSPVDWLRIYFAKLSETVLHSSWMVALIAVPILTAYGMVYHGGPLFLLVAIGALLPYFVLPAVIGSALTLVLVNVFPARRTRDLLSLVAIGAVGGLVLLFRLIRPEQLARPEGVRNLLDYLSALNTPTSPFLPSEWATAMLMNWLHRVADPLPILLLWTTAPAFVVMGALLHARLYAQGFSKAQEGAERFVRGRGWSGIMSRLFGSMPAARREFVLKDLRVFFRDTTQWSQLILLAVLLVVYVFNIKSLGLFSGERVSAFLVSLVVFLNLGLAGFVLAAIAARFVFPAISLEGRQMWLLRSSPLDLQALLWSKYWTGTVPLLVLAVVITFSTSVLLQATPFMTAVSLGTIVLLTFAISGMALGFGTLYPQFDTENAAQIPTSFGGLVFMMSAILLLGLVLMVEARPVLGYLRAQIQGQDPDVDIWLVSSLVLVVAICSTATILPLRLALRKLERMEF